MRTAYIGTQYLISIFADYYSGVVLWFGFISMIFVAALYLEVSLYNITHMY